MRARAHTHTYIHTHTYTHARTHTHTHTRTHARTYACTHAHTHAHTYTHTHTHTHMYKRAQSTHKLPIHSAKGFANFSASLAMLPPLVNETCHPHPSRSISFFKVSHYKPPILLYTGNYHTQAHIHLCTNACTCKHIYKHMHTNTSSHPV